MASVSYQTSSPSITILSYDENESPRIYHDSDIFVKANADCLSTRQMRKDAETVEPPTAVELAKLIRSVSSLVLGSVVHNSDGRAKPSKSFENDLSCYRSITRPKIDDSAVGMFSDKDTYVSDAVFDSETMNEIPLTDVDESVGDFAYDAIGNCKEGPVDNSIHDIQHYDLTDLMKRIQRSHDLGEACFKGMINELAADQLPLDNFPGLRNLWNDIQNSRVKTIDEIKESVAFFKTQMEQHCKWEDHMYYAINQLKYVILAESLKEDHSPKEISLRSSPTFTVEPKVKPNTYLALARSRKMAGLPDRIWKHSSSNTTLLKPRNVTPSVSQAAHRLRCQAAVSTSANPYGGRRTNAYSRDCTPPPTAREIAKEMKSPKHGQVRRLLEENYGTFYKSHHKVERTTPAAKTAGGKDTENGPRKGDTNKGKFFTAIYRRISKQDLGKKDGRCVWKEELKMDDSGTALVKKGARNRINLFHEITSIGRRCHSLPDITGKLFPKRKAIAKAKMMQTKSLDATGSDSDLDTLYKYLVNSVEMEIDTFLKPRGVKVVHARHIINGCKLRPCLSFSSVIRSSKDLI